MCVCTQGTAEARREEQLPQVRNVITHGRGRYDCISNVWPVAVYYRQDTPRCCLPLASLWPIVDSTAAAEQVRPVIVL